MSIEEEQCEPWVDSNDASTTGEQVDLDEMPSRGSWDQEKLERWLLGAFEAEPLEDGMEHEAEQIIRSALQSSDNQRVLDGLKAFSLDATRPSFAASVVRCLGRQGNPGTMSWRTQLLQAVLGSGDVEMRDAAVQAAAWWGGQEIRAILQDHFEPVPWLRDYIREVARDLAQ